jgi:hypothetical protein
MKCLKKESAALRLKTDSFVVGSRYPLSDRLQLAMGQCTYVHKYRREASGARMAKGCWLAQTAKSPDAQRTQGQQRRRKKQS